MRLIEGLGKSPEIKIQTKGADTVYQWIKAQQDFRNDPASIGNEDDDPQLVLLSVPLDGKILQGVQVDIVHSDQGYKLSAKLISKIPQVDLMSMLRIQLPGGQGPSSKDSDKEKQKQWQEIQKALNKKLTKQGYILNSSQEGEIEIHKDGKRAEDNIDAYVVHSLDQSGTEGFCMHRRNNRVDSNQAQFSEEYEAFGLVFQHVINSIYTSNNNPSPDKTLVLEPPQNTLSRLDQRKKRLSMQKRMLEMAGVSDEGLIEEARATKLIQKPDVRFEDIGGLEDAKKELSSVILGILHPEVFKEWGTSPPKGVLLYGEPGTGKTLLAKAIANESNAEIYVVRLSEVLHHLYGKTERLLAEVFRQAEQEKSAIIFIDELDALASQRDHSSDVNSRVVSVLLTKMDGLDEAKGNVTVIGATNRFDALDHALLRAKRFSMLVNVTKPDSLGRASTLDIHARLTREEAQKIGSTRQLFHQDFDISALAKKTDGFTGADLEELIRRALVKKVKQTIEGRETGPVTTEDIIAEILPYEHNVKTTKDQAFGLLAASKRQTSSDK